MTFEIRPASPENQPAIVGLTGPSGSGKTLSALRLAHGMQEVFGGDVGMIDTEGRRGLRYSDKAKYPRFNYRYLEFQPPFSSLRYAEALKAMLAHGCKNIIVDSMSHEHEGQGGYLEMHETEIDRMLGPDKKDNYRERKKMTFTGWIKPAADRRILINAFLQQHANFIFCFRAKEKIKPVSGGEPVQLGWQAIAGDEFVYEMIVRCLLLPGSKGVPDWSDAAFAHGAAKLDDQDKYLFPVDAQLSETIGHNVALAVSGKAPENKTSTSSSTEPRRTEFKPPAPMTIDDFPPELLEKEKSLGAAAAAQGIEHLARWFRSLDKDLQRVLTPFKDELKVTAEAADKKAKEEAQ